MSDDGFDLSEFRQTFIEESLEGIELMEAGLLRLDPEQPDKELIDDIFRAAHSIKGGSGTFGFDRLGAFTHDLETMLDGVRNGEIAPTTQMIDTLLACVDCLSEMLNNPEDDAAVPEQRLVELQGQLQEYIDIDQPTAGEGDSAVDAAAPEPLVGSVVENALSLQGQHRWILRFSPLNHLFETGNDPLRLLQEIATLGELDVHLDDSKLPESAANFDPEKCYLAWDLTLTTDVDEVAIREIFEWVEDDCELSITLLSSDDDQKIGLESEQGKPAEAEQLESLEQTNGDTDPAAPDPAQGSVIALVADQSNTRTEAPSEPNSVSSSTQKSSTQKKAGKLKGDGPSIRVSTDKVDHLINMVGELVITHSMLNQLSEVDELGELEMEKMRDGLSSLNRNIRELQERVMSIRMLPISVVFNRFPRMVRDLSNQLGKQIVLEIKGEGTELDKTVLESMGDPLTHLVRNSLDHGLEMPEDRVAAGKPEVGTITLEAFHRGGSIIIEVRDDGGGIDTEVIFAKAVEKGLVGAADTLNDQQIYQLLFSAGFSTAAAITDISGRGVGMDVVRSNITSLGGSIEITSKLGEGTCVSVSLPLTLAILDGQTVRVGTEMYIIPLVSIVESVQVKPEDINRPMNGDMELFLLRDEYLPLLRLNNHFRSPPADEEEDYGLVVICEASGQRVGLAIDDLMGQQQVVIKSLEENFYPVEGFSGATILGDGRVALIVDVGGLLSSATAASTGVKLKAIA